MSQLTSPDQRITPKPELQPAETGETVADARERTDRVVDSAPVDSVDAVRALVMSHALDTADALTEPKDVAAAPAETEPTLSHPEAARVMGGALVLLRDWVVGDKGISDN